MNIIYNTEKTRQELMNGTYTGRGFTEFHLCERGKMRHIRSVHISERVVQRTLCDRVIVPTFSPALIYDNGASSRGKGISFALDRVTCHLQRHYRKYGNQGYVLLFDFSAYFDNAQHWTVKQELEKRIHDERTRALANMCLDAFGEVGYGLGSQISQMAALMLPNKLDHVIKEELGIKGYARYMDDGYLIHHDKVYLEHCLERIKEVCEELGIVLNLKKTTIKRLDQGFKFLKIKFRLTETGKVVRKMNYDSVKTMRRKLKKFKRWNEEGRVVKLDGKPVRKEFPLADVCAAYASWRSYMAHSDSYRTVRRMDEYFEKLFGLSPDDKEAWREAINPKDNKGAGELCTELKMLQQVRSSRTSFPLSGCANRS